MSFSQALIELAMNRWKFLPVKNLTLHGERLNASQAKVWLSGLFF